MNHNNGFASFCIAHMEALHISTLSNPIRRTQFFNTWFPYFSFYHSSLKRNWKSAVYKASFSHFSYYCNACHYDSIIATNAICHIQFYTLCTFYSVLLCVLKVKAGNVHVYTTCVKCSLMSVQENKLKPIGRRLQYAKWSNYHVIYNRNIIFKLTSAHFY